MASSDKTVLGAAGAVAASALEDRDAAVRDAAVCTRWTSRVSLPQNVEGYVAKSIPLKASNSISSGKLTFDERLAVHRVGIRAGTRVSVERIRHT